jgi:hypoxanthine phosphoribosyltransferase
VQDRIEEYISAERIAARVAELGRRISDDYAARELLLVAVLKGSVVFLADLMRRIEGRVSVDFLCASSYGDATESSGVVQIKKDLDSSAAGKHVLLIEDIVDTGLTMHFLVGHLQAGAPATLRTCALLDKPSRRKIPFQADYVGFEIEDVFVVGYGLDAGEQFRQLPSLCCVRPSAS